jgi:hypothetical protein
LLLEISSLLFFSATRHNLSSILTPSISRAIKFLNPKGFVVYQSRTNFANYLVFIMLWRFG